MTNRSRAVKLLNDLVHSDLVQVHQTGTAWSKDLLHASPSAAGGGGGREHHLLNDALLERLQQSAGDARLERLKQSAEEGEHRLAAFGEVEDSHARLEWIRQSVTEGQYSRRTMDLRERVLSEQIEDRKRHLLERSIKAQHTNGMSAETSGQAFRAAHQYSLPPTVDVDEQIELKKRELLEAQHREVQHREAQHADAMYAETSGPASRAPHRYPPPPPTVDVDEQIDVKKRQLLQAQHADAVRDVVRSMEAESSMEAGSAAAHVFSVPEGAELTRRCHLSEEELVGLADFRVKAQYNEAAREIELLRSERLQQAMRIDLLEQDLRRAEGTPPDCSFSFVP